MSPKPIPDPEPVNPELARHLTRWVYELRSRTRRRLFPAAAFLQPLDREGAPAGAPGRDLLGATMLVPDYALRVDLLVGGLSAVTAPTALVVVRPGPDSPTPNDAVWSQAWNAANGVAGREPGPLFAVARAGWLDVQGRTSVPVPRLRDRRRAA